MWVHSRLAVKPVTSYQFTVYSQDITLYIVPCMTKTNQYYHQNYSVLNCFPFQGRIAPLFVVEITVFPWRNQQLKTKKGQLDLDLHPVYEDEEGKCYFRRQASLVQVV